MADFNANGFSAVAAIFGKGADVPEERRGENSHRVGVGGNFATSKRKQTNDGLGDDETRNKILRVGKGNRKHDNYCDGDDVTDSGSSSESDEEDGRTSVFKTKAVTKANHHVLKKTDLERKKPTKKKKAGKKERERLAASSAENGEPVVSKQAEGIGSEKVSTVDELENRPNANRTIKKRKKVRSRQKNIRKDTRKEKPVHLISGGSNFLGRPMTRETRSRIEKSSSNKTQKQHNNLGKHTCSGEGTRDLSGHNDNEHSVSVSDQNIDKLVEIPSKETLMLDNHTGNGIQVPSKDASVGKLPKKKKRFKNLG